MSEATRAAEAKAKAEALFKKLLGPSDQAEVGREAADVEAAAVAEKTARLRAMRLAKEAAPIKPTRQR